MHRRFVVQVVTGLLMAGFFLFAISLYGRFTAYIAINKERLDPLGIGELTEGSKNISYKIAFFGDSRALAWGNYLAKQGIEILNLGMANQTSAQARYRIDYQSNTLDLDYIVIQIGINDLKQINSSGSNYQSIVNQCKSNIGYIALKAKAMAKTVVLSTIFPPGEPPVWRRFFMSEKVIDAVNEVNAYIRGIEGVEVYNAHEFLVGEDGYVKSIYFRDTLHINERAYIEMDLLSSFETAK